jgi:hypothetical protein
LFENVWRGVHRSRIMQPASGLRQSELAYRSTTVR